MNGGELGHTAEIDRVLKNRNPRQSWHHLLENLHPLGAQIDFRRRKARGVAARPRQALDHAERHRIGDGDENNGTLRLACCKASTAGGEAATMRSGFELQPALRHSSARVRRQRPSEYRAGYCGPRSSRIRRATSAMRQSSASHQGSPSGKFMKTPMWRTRLSCCARTASGHAAVRPPASAMKSRRLTRSPRRRA